MSEISEKRPKTAEKQKKNGKQKLAKVKPVQNWDHVKEKEVPKLQIEGDDNSSHVNKSPRSQLVKERAVGLPICKFDDFGCDFKGTKDQIKQHIDGEPVRHLSFIGDSVCALKAAILKLNDESKSQVDRFEDVYVRHDRLMKRYGSHLLWKISGFQEKLEKAKAGVERIIFSPTFMTAAHGYRMMASLALNGDGAGKDKFVSIFVALIRGEYDSLLVWPFLNSITITVLDQSTNVGARRDITKILTPNSRGENAVFLGRPTQERNPSFGFQKFAEIEALKDLDYVKDDALFVRINVDADHMDVL